MRHLIIRKGRDEIIGIVRIPEGSLVYRIHPRNEDGVHVENVSEAEYSSYKALSLFPEYTTHTSPTIVPDVTIYDSRIYKVKGDRIVKRGKRDERERRKKLKQEKRDKQCVT